MLKNRIVIKVGTGVLTKGVLTKPEGYLNRANLLYLVATVAELQSQGFECVIVSSGAVAAGAETLSLEAYPEDLATKQACAAVGQGQLMHAYQNLFENFEIKVAQVLLSEPNLATPAESELVKSLFDRLISESSIIPIINENDAVALEALKFTDNDQLAVKVAKLIGAEKMFLLSSVDGLHPPDSDEVLSEVPDMSVVMDYANGKSGLFSTGGMEFKLRAIQEAVENNIETYLINGDQPHRILEFLTADPEAIGTKFLVQ